MKATVKDNKLILEIDLTEPVLSKSGKMSLVGSTGGWIDLGVKKDEKLLRANVMVGFYTHQR